MKPEKYLSPRGKRNFKKLEKLLQSRGVVDEIYSIELSMLANELDRYETAIETGNDKGFYNYFEKGGTVQVNAYHTMAKTALDHVMKLGAKFGLSPKDFKDIEGAKEKKEKKESKLNILRDIGS